MARIVRCFTPFYNINFWRQFGVAGSLAYGLRFHAARGRWQGGRTVAVLDLYVTVSTTFTDYPVSP
jgi:hypothetical protein